MKPFHLASAGPLSGAAPLGAAGLSLLTVVVAVGVVRAPADGLAMFSGAAAWMPALGVLMGAAVGAWGGAGSWAGGAARVAAGGAALLAALWFTPAWAAWGSLPFPGWAGAVLAGLYLSGASFAPAEGVAGPLPVGVRRGALLLLLGWGADGAAAGWGILEPSPPWSPGVAGAMLDLAPRTLLMESAGVDWMRHPMVYGPVGTDRIGPGIRSVYAGPVAGSATLLVGCLLMAARIVVERRRLRP